MFNILKCPYIVCQQKFQREAAVKQLKWTDGALYSGDDTGKICKVSFYSHQKPTDQVPHSSVTPNMMRNTSDLMIQWSPMLELCWQRDTYSDIGGHILLLGQHNSTIISMRQRHRWRPISIVEMEDLYF